MYRRSMRDTVLLKPQELCDLLNYTIGYKRSLNPRCRPQPIEVFVIKTWTTRQHSGGGLQYRVQRWCEEILRFHGVLERRRLPPCLVPPAEIQRLCTSRDIARLQTL
jgi:hypothetical protein